MSWNWHKSEYLTNDKKDEIVKEISQFVSEADFMLESRKHGEIKNLTYKRYDFICNEFDHYCDFSMAYNGNPHSKCGLYNYTCGWEKLNIEPLSLKLANVSGILGYAIVCNYGVSYYGQDSVICLVKKQNDNWLVVNN
ncbi:MAG: hypothetical protein C0597_00720 [Marinilabiliales bacterium]|nr:MAG: hypothetical protein C0597_00720 [Marinilabiliales bacterium]